MTALLADLLAEQYHPTAAAAVRAGHCDLVAGFAVGRVEVPARPEPLPLLAIGGAP